jgi:hypothetical protein
MQITVMSLYRWLRYGDTHTVRPMQRTSLRQTTSLRPLPAAAPRLRVVQGTTGRMRISGRMADVCAELDRLAA